jgi:mRNA export factor
VNNIAFNRKFNTFATFGSDGVFVTWNKDTKSKYVSCKAMPLAMQASDVSDNGQMIGYVVGYDWSAGFDSPNKTMPNTFIIRVPEEVEIFKKSNTR